MERCLRDISLTVRASLAVNHNIIVPASQGDVPASQGDIRQLVHLWARAMADDEERLRGLLDEEKKLYDKVKMLARAIVENREVTIKKKGEIEGNDVTKVGEIKPEMGEAKIEMESVEVEKGELGMVVFDCETELKDKCASNW